MAVASGSFSWLLCLSTRVELALHTSCGRQGFKGIKTETECVCVCVSYPIQLGMVGSKKGSPAFEGGGMPWTLRVRATKNPKITYRTCKIDPKWPYRAKGGSVPYFGKTHIGKGPLCALARKHMKQQSAMHTVKKIAVHGQTKRNCQSPPPPPPPGKKRKKHFEGPRRKHGKSSPRCWPNGFHLLSRHSSRSKVMARKS